jgi:hypothetical protein
MQLTADIVEAIQQLALEQRGLIGVRAQGTSASPARATRPAG